jgi:hypothetical protein
MPIEVNLEQHVEATSELKVLEAEMRRNLTAGQSHMVARPLTALQRRSSRPRECRKGYQTDPEASSSQICATVRDIATKP